MSDHGWRVWTDETERAIPFATREEAEAEGQELLQQFAREKPDETRTVLMYRASELTTPTQTEMAGVLGRWDPNAGLVDNDGNSLNL